MIIRNTNQKEIRVVLLNQKNTIKERDPGHVLFHIIPLEKTRKKKIIQDQLLHLEANTEKIKDILVKNLLTLKNSKKN